MAGVAVRPGLYRETVAGIAWALLRLRGRCMGVRELTRELQDLGLDVRRGKVQEALTEYNGILFRRVRNGSKILYCAEERV